MSVQLEIPDTDITLEGEYKGPFTSCQVAKYIVDLPEGEIPTRLCISKLVKLVFIAHGWLLGLTNGKRLLVREQEPVETWNHGPAFGRLYRKIELLRKMGGFPKHKDYQHMLGRVSPIEEGIETQLIRYICKRYDKYDAWGLIELTSRSQSPWNISYSFGSDVISNRLIADCYREGLYPRDKTARIKIAFPKIGSHLQQICYFWLQLLLLSALFLGIALGFLGSVWLVLEVADSMAQGLAPE